MVLDDSDQAWGKVGKSALLAPRSLLLGASSGSLSPLHVPSRVICYLSSRRFRYASVHWARCSIVGAPSSSERHIEISHSAAYRWHDDQLEAIGFGSPDEGIMDKGAQEMP